jgi:hypothetical protein
MMMKKRQRKRRRKGKKKKQMGGDNCGKSMELHNTITVSSKFI